MKLHLTVVTGASRGLGQAMTAQRLAQGHRVLALARSPVELPLPAGAELVSWRADLVDPAPVADRLEQWLRSQDPTLLASATLINNAALMNRPAPLSALGTVELSEAVRVGLEAPLLLSAAFLRATADWPAPRRLLMVSSGLGRRGMAGGASYCTIKAGLDNLARALALEEADKPCGARVSSMAPGVIDTDMQLQLRSADPGEFSSQARFARLKAEGLLPTASQVARQMLERLDRPDFGDEPVSDVRGAPAASA